VGRAHGIFLSLELAISTRADRGGTTEHDVEYGAPMHAVSRARLLSFFTFVSFLVVASGFAGCSLTTSWDGLKLDVAPDAPDATDAPEPNANDEDAAPARCVADRYYCGGNGVVGEPSTLYRCLADGGATAALPCEHGCARRGDGSGTVDDACICVVGSPYCGNDQIVGDKNTLYKCESDYSGSLVTHCDAGCFVHAGANDACH
jgi:hypothetical protein